MSLGPSALASVNKPRAIAARTVSLSHKPFTITWPWHTGPNPSPQANPHTRGTQSGSDQPRPTRNRSILGGQSGPLTPRRQPIPANTRCSANTSPRSPRVRAGRGCGRAPTLLDPSCLLHSDWLWSEGTPCPLAAAGSAWAGWKAACRSAGLQERRAAFSRTWWRSGILRSDSNNKESAYYPWLLSIDLRLSGKTSTQLLLSECPISSLGVEHRKIKMESLSDVASFSTKLQNTLIQYHSIEEDNYKAQGVMDDVVNSVIDHIRPGPWRLDWDRLMTSLDILEHFEENCCVMRYTTAGQLLNIISPREFVDFSYTVGYEEGLLSCGVSLDWSETRPEFVRGYNYPCGWFCVPVKDNPSQSLLTGYIQTDLRGMIPQSAVDTAMASTLTNFYGDLRKALRKA
ncbi:StAR-related lipid transfer (START) domain containing 4 [Cricetulus griseus]